MLFNTVYNLALNLLVELSFDILYNPPLKTNIFNQFRPFSFPPHLHYILECIRVVQNV